VLHTFIYHAVDGTLGDHWYPVAPLSSFNFSWVILDGDNVPDPSTSYYVPQADSLTTLVEGHSAYKTFRTCPNNDELFLPWNPRIKVVLNNAANQPIDSVAANDVFVLLNGGTPAQGFAADGADSVIATNAYNSEHGCPDLTSIPADTMTTSTGTTWITFPGFSSAAHAVRDPSRKWGHYDSDLPVYALGVKLQGRYTSSSDNGTYTLRIKNVDWTGGLGTTVNAGEAVTVSDYNGIWNSLGVNNTISYWKDLNFDGTVSFTDGNIASQHLNHQCDYPNGD